MYLSKRFAQLKDKAVPRQNKKRDELAVLCGKIIGDDYVIEDEFSRRAYESDALLSHAALPRLVVLPKTTEEVSQILKLANARQIPVIPRGAGTSLCGGATPCEQSLVICLSRMSSILEISEMDRYAHVQAGATNLSISKAAGAYDLFYAPDPSSQIACTIGGNIATNSGGAHCLKYGVTTNNLLGVKVVLMSGDIIDLGGPYLEASGYDLLGLITGSEGLLGLVTEAYVKLVPSPIGARPVLFGFNSASEAGECVANIIGGGIIPVAIEFMDRPAIELCEAFAKAGYPDVEALLIVEVEGDEEEIDYQLDKIIKIARRSGMTEMKMSQSADESALIWKGRKAAFGAAGRISDYICVDGVIPLGQLATVLPKVNEICAAHSFRVANIFHAGDGNLHPLIMFDANKEGELERVEKAGGEILRLCVRAGGCLTGEHGVGIEKRDLMDAQFSQDDLIGQMRIKSVFDPGWLLNRDKVFPLEVRDEFLANTGSSVS